MIVKNISQGEFVESFDDMNRTANFSIEGREALFDYLEQLSEDVEKPIELDVIALCCEYQEYENLKELQNDYKDIKSREDLENHTTVIDIPNRDEAFIIAQY